MSTRIAGDAFGFREPPTGHALPGDWRELDRAVWRWMLAHGADDTLAHAAAWVSHAEGLGHSALPLARLDELIAPARRSRLPEALRASALVADGADARSGTRPLVRDGEHLYLLRNHRTEVAVAQALAQRRTAAAAPACPLTDDELRALFNGSWRDEEARQRDAVRQAPGRRLMVLTGGPGTGKTTTVLRMLLGLSREHQARAGRLPQMHIAAPTGKAAQRLSQSLRDGSDRLRDGAHPLGEAWSLHLSAVLGAASGTVHRLLGSRGRHGGFRFHADEPLPADIVVVDEASMLDLGLLRALLVALREDAVLVLVGDADQLTSVGTGSVMMDIVQALEADPRGDLVRLSHCFRADASLVPINEAVRTGDAAAFAAAMHQTAARDVDIGPPAATTCLVPDVSALRQRVVTWVRRLKATLASVDITTPLAAADAALSERLAVLRRQQLLCALREGPFGAVQVAAAIASGLRSWEALQPWAGRPWYPGRAIIITRNDHSARLFNGDVGLCVLACGPEDKPMLQVAFEPAPDALDAGASPRVRLFDPSTLPPHEDAFALTVHKSQGSEYEHVALLLPPDGQSPLLVRQTLYTGLSRARQSVELWTTPIATEKAISTAMFRHGRLADRMADHARD